MLSRFRNIQTIASSLLLAAGVLTGGMAKGQSPEPANQHRAAQIQSAAARIALQGAPSGESESTSLVRLNIAPGMSLQWRPAGRLDRAQDAYRMLSQSLAARWFDDADGKRISFDVDGRPGVALEIVWD